LKDELLINALKNISLPDGPNAYEKAQQEEKDFREQGNILRSGVSKNKRGFYAKKGNTALGTFAIYSPYRDDTKARTLAIGLCIAKSKHDELVPNATFISEKDKRIREIVGEKIWTEAEKKAKESPTDNRQKFTKWYGKERFAFEVNEPTRDALMAKTLSIAVSNYHRALAEQNTSGQ